MLQGFEQITHELTQYEESTLLPIIVAGLREKAGKKKSCYINLHLSINERCWV